MFDKLCAHARVEGLDPVRACANATFPIGVAVGVCRHDGDVIVGQDVGQVGQTLIKLNDQCEIPIGTHIDDVGEK